MVIFPRRLIRFCNGLVKNNDHEQHPHPAGTWSFSLPAAAHAGRGCTWTPPSHPHDLCGGTTLGEQRDHAAHGRGDVVEEKLVSRTKVVQTILAGAGRAGRMVAGALAMAGEAHVTGEAGSGEAIALIQAELALAG